MYKLVKIEDTVRIPPNRFSEDLEDAIVSEVDNTIAGRVDREIGVIIAATKVEKVGKGKIILGDGAIHYDCVFEALVYTPTLHEVVEGGVSEITEFGAFVNFGPMDGLVHVSQVTEDFMNYDGKNAVLAGKESKKTLKVGDLVKARVVTVSLKDRVSDSKIGLTMRQPNLGKKEWIEEEKKKSKGEKKEAPKKKPEESKKKGEE
jgi:DNA-directed RNA polymerase subunit E'